MHVARNLIECVINILGYLLVRENGIRRDENEDNSNPYPFARD